MKAMILAAGLGTRLRPVTDFLAKPAVPFMNVPLLYYPVALVESGGARELIVNSSYKAEQVERLAHSIPGFSGPVHLSHEPGEPLGSGGGVWKARKHLEDGDFFLANGDEVILPKDAAVMAKFREEHFSHGALATILVMRDPRVGTQFGGVWAGPEGRVRGFGKDGSKFGADASGFHYIGLQILSPRVFKYLPEGHSNILYDALAAGIAAGETVRVVVAEFSWFETGNPRDFLHATGESFELLAHVTNKGVEHGHEKIHPDTQPTADCAFLQCTLERFAGGPNCAQLAESHDPRLKDVDISVGTRVLLGKDCVIEAGATLRGFVVIGEGAHVKPGASLSNTVVLPGVVVESNRHVADQIVTPT
jgi:mannose-1-phosphate guanylyltransferase